VFLFENISDPINSITPIINIHLTIEIALFNTKRAKSFAPNNINIRKIIIAEIKIRLIF
jgi:hypothetical protein